MKLIVGLGNIGKKYEDTRHNIGFMVVDELVRRWDIRFKEENIAFYAEKHLKEKVVLLKPKTYMNLSGQAVEVFANYYDIQLDDIAVIQDDLDLPSGKVRIRRKGSAGGHKGIISITEHLKSADFSRFKIGIGHPGHVEKTVVRYVLEKFDKEEQSLIDEAVKKTADALECWLDSDINVTMNRFNS